MFGLIFQWNLFVYVQFFFLLLIFTHLQQINKTNPNNHLIVIGSIYVNVMILFSRRRKKH